MLCIRVNLVILCQQIEVYFGWFNSCEGSICSLHMSRVHHSVLTDLPVT